MTSTATEPGRRRADTPSVFGNDFPEHAPKDPTAPSPLEDAFAFTTDRLDRLEHMLGSLQATIQRAGTRLEPLLTDGSYGGPEADTTELATPSPEDRRSTITKRVTRIGQRVDESADFTARLERRLEALLDALEV